MSDRDAAAAAGHARRMSAILRAAGFVMSRKVDRWEWTEGYIVHRVGCSATVAVRWRPKRYGTARASWRERLEAVRGALAEKGYVLDERGWWKQAS